MFKDASSLPKKVTKQQIIDFLEDYIMECIEADARRGRTETCVSGYSISVNPQTGEMCTGLHDRNESKDFVWQWKSIRDYLNEVTDDLRDAGYKVYDKNRNGCVWVNWE